MCSCVSYLDWTRKLPDHQLRSELNHTEQWHILGHAAVQVKHTNRNIYINIHIFV